MTFSCPGCDAAHDVEPRYCTECGAEVNLDANPEQALASEQSFFERHKLKILALTGVQLLPLIPMFLAATNPGAMVGLLFGAGLAALAVSYVVVYLFVGLADSVRRTTGTRD